MAAPAYAMRLRGVGVHYQRQRSLLARDENVFAALRDVSFDLAHGEKLGVIGRNGAGKTTLLRVLAGVLEPDTGTLERSHGSCRLLGLGTGFMPNLTGRENAVLSGLVLGMPRRRVVSRLEEIKAFSGLGDFFDQPVRTYSTGMRSRLGFSVAIQQDPDVLLIDETLGVGDAAFYKKSLDAMRARMRDDATVVMVSHSTGTMLEVCNRGLWLDKGKVMAQGPVADILAAYRGHKPPEGKRGPES